MITFVQLCERLARGQLKNTAAVEQSNLGEISPEYLDTILSLANQGLTDLTSRKPLIKKQVDLSFETGRNLYNLSAVGVASGYLDDSQTGEFIPEDFVAVLNIYGENGKRHAHDSGGHITTPSYNTLRFTTAKMDELHPKVRVEYQAKHTVIDRDSLITIPPTMETALQLFVASLYLSHMNGADHSTKGDSYYAAYLRHIGEDEARNTSSTSEIDADSRFQDRGFV